MKTKLIKSILLTIGILTMSLMVACGVTSIIQIEFIESPQNVYILGENGNKVTAEIKITYSDGKSVTSNLDKAPTYGISVTGDSFSAVGDYTLVVSYGAIKASFEYKVVENQNLYARGAGTQESPYEIETPLHLSNIRFNLDAHYKLTKDIDLTGFDWVPIGEVTFTPVSNVEYKVEIKEAFSGILDGAKDALGRKYKISNLTITESINRNAALFDAICGESNAKRAEIKNLDLVNFNVAPVNHRVAGLAVSALYANFTNIETSNMKLKGTRISGLVSDSLFVDFVNCKTNSNFTFTLDHKDYNGGNNTGNNEYFFGGGLTSQVEDGTKKPDNSAPAELSDSKNIALRIIDCEAIFTVTENYLGRIPSAALANGQPTKFTPYIGKFIGQASNTNKYIIMEQTGNAAKFYSCVYPQNSGGVTKTAQEVLTEIVNAINLADVITKTSEVVVQHYHPDKNDYVFVWNSETDIKLILNPNPSTPS